MANRVSLGKAASAAVFLAFASLPASAADVVVFDGGAPDQGGQLYAQSPALEAMSFTLSRAQMSSTTPTGGAGASRRRHAAARLTSPSVSIQTISGIPGSAIQSYSVGSANQTATGNTIGGPLDQGGWDEYAYNASFASLTLTPGTQYWFVLTQGTLEPDGSWGVETASGTNSTTYSMGLQEPLESWVTQPQTLAFQLTFSSSVPEPSTWVMMIAGFAGLGFLGYRQTVKARVAA